MTAEQAVLERWRRVVSSLEDDARVTARLMGYVYLAQPQGSSCPRPWATPSSATA